MDKRSDKLTTQSSDSNDGLHTLNLFMFWKKAKWFFIASSLLFSNMIVCFQRDVIIDKLSPMRSIIGLKSNLISHKLIFALILIFFIVVIMAIYIFLHELIHMLFHFDKMKYCRLLFSKTAISVESNCWIAKWRYLIMIIAPFAFFELIAFLTGFLLNSLLAGLFITVLNYAFSSSDIVTFFYVLFKVPAKCEIKGNVYKHQ